jgi:Tetratricopeptide repeat
VVEARKRTLGEEHPDTLSSIHALAFLYSETGRWPEALRLMEQVVEARKRTLGEEHPDTLASVNPVNDEGFTALYYAAEMRRLESVRVLLARDDVDRTIRSQESMARILNVPNGP